MPTTESGIHSTLWRDVMSDVDPVVRATQPMHVREPLIQWIWGGGLIALFGLGVTPSAGGVQRDAVWRPQSAEAV
jgi:cytochrome c biogenesis factor